MLGPAMTARRQKICSVKASGVTFRVSRVEGISASKREESAFAKGEFFNRDVLVMSNGDGSHLTRCDDLKKNVVIFPEERRRCALGSPK